MLPNPDSWLAGEKEKKKEMQNKSETASTGQYFRSTISRVRVSYLRSRIFHWFWKKTKFTQTTIIQQKGSPCGKTLA